MHTIEITTNYLQNPYDDFLSERPLEIVFEFDNEGFYTIENYLIDSKIVKISSLKEYNPTIDKHIDYEICEYILNQEKIA